MPRGRKKQALGPGTKPKCLLRITTRELSKGMDPVLEKREPASFRLLLLRLGRAGEKLHAPRKFLFFLPRRFSRLLRCKLRPSPRAQRSKDLACSGDSNAAALPMPCPFLLRGSDTFLKHGRSGALYLRLRNFPLLAFLAGSPPPLPPASSGLIRAPLESSQPSRAARSSRGARASGLSPSRPHLPPHRPQSHFSVPPKRRLPNSNPRWTHCNMFRPLPALLLAPGHSTACPRASRLDGRPFPCLDIQRSIEVGRPSIRSERSRLPFPPKV